MSTFSAVSSLPLRVGLVGTGYAAKLRAETLQADTRSQLVAIAGHTLEKTQAFSQTYQATAFSSGMELAQHPDLDLVVIANVNRDHGAIARAALEAGKHVVVEYPLSLEVAEAQALIQLAQAQGKLLHVEHIELLGGLHQALKHSLSAVGKIFSARYATINPQRPAPAKWTYQPELFGFPLVGALSRIQRLTDLFGPVKTVHCQARFWGPKGEISLESASPYTTCLCVAQLRFQNDIHAEVTYGKGEALWQAVRTFEVQGQEGGLLFDGDQGTLVQAAGTQPIKVGGRRGLFAKDTQMVLAHLTEGTPLYIEPTASLYALRVADAARRSAITGQVVEVE